MIPIIFHGERVIIKLTEENDLKYIKDLWNEGEVMKWVGFPNGLDVTIEKVKEWFEKIRNYELAKHFVVYTNENTFCGELFYRKDVEHQRAGLDIKFLPNSRGKGLAAESLKLLIEYIFNNENNINAVWTEPSIDNFSARKLYSKCGLTEKVRPMDMKSADSYWELSRNELKKHNSR